MTIISDELMNKLVDNVQQLIDNVFEKHIIGIDKYLKIPNMRNTLDCNLLRKKSWNLL
jgi:hypothetical protein